MDKDKTIQHADCPRVDRPPEITHTGGPPPPSERVENPKHIDV